MTHPIESMKSAMHSGTETEKSEVTHKTANIRNRGETNQTYVG
jgi:hypothetical protein